MTVSFGTTRSDRMPVRPILQPTFVRRFRRICTTPLGWYERWLQRQDLGDLDDRLLADIGVSRDAARREAEKPFWR